METFRLSQSGVQQLGTRMNAQYRYQVEASQNLRRCICCTLFSSHSRLRAGSLSLHSAVIGRFLLVAWALRCRRCSAPLLSTRRHTARRHGRASNSRNFNFLTDFLFNPIPAIPQSSTLGISVCTTPFRFRTSLPGKDQ